MIEENTYFPLRKLIQLQIDTAYCKSSIKFSKPKSLIGLGHDCDLQVVSYFHTCVFKSEVIFGNIAFYPHKTLAVKNTDSELNTVAHDSGYLEFARYDADGSRFFVNPVSGSIYALYLGSIDEEGIFGEDDQGDYGYQEISEVNDQQMRSAAWQSWDSFQDFLSENLHAIDQSQ